MEVLRLRLSWEAWEGFEQRVSRAAESVMCEERAISPQRKSPSPGPFRAQPCPPGSRPIRSPPVTPVEAAGSWRLPLTRAQTRLASGAHEPQEPGGDSSSISPSPETPNLQGGDCDGQEGRCLEAAARLHA